jgi:hypothetical protein
MEFQNHVLGSGPVQIYPESTVNGFLIYDYDRSAWHFQNITVVYVVDGRQLSDKLSGNIRWVENQNRKLNGEGEYQFDIRINEPLPNESDVFSGPQDEASFFDTDIKVESLTGNMKYKDSLVGGSVVSSNVKINLIGNKLNKQRLMYLSKLILFSTIVPFNAE